MTKELIIALLALLGTLGGSFMGVLTANRLVNYRIEQLEKKVDKHNNVIERTYKIQKSFVTKNYFNDYVRETYLMLQKQGGEYLLSVLNYYLRFLLFGYYLVLSA